MIDPDKYIGRMGNKMFIYAYLYATAHRLGIDTYFQDPKWFEGYEADIKQIYSTGIEPIDMVAVHIRRGDYVGHPMYVDLSITDYYDNAMKQFTDETFLVFSDDIKWCQEYFDGRKDIEFCEEEDPVKAFNLMAGCKGIIMANSSYSWWAAYLSKGKVIAPSEWFKDGTSIKLIETWQKI